MNTFWDFANSSPIAAVALVLFAIYIPCRYAWKAYLSYNRRKNIAAKGWPPPHLDADGDFRPEPEQQETDEEDEHDGVSIKIDRTRKK